MKMRRSNNRGRFAGWTRLRFSILLVLCGVLLTSAAIVGLLWWETRLGDAMVDGEPPSGFVLQGQLLSEEWQPQLTGDKQLLIPASLLVEVFDLPVHWERVPKTDDDQPIVIWSLPQGALELEIGQMYGDIDDEQVQLLAPVQMIDGVPHIPAGFVALLTDFRFEYHENTERAVIREIGAPKVQGTLQHSRPVSGSVVSNLVNWMPFFRGEEDDVALRTAADATAPILRELPIGQNVEVHRSSDNWALVEAEGITGYVPFHSLEIKEVRLYEDAHEPAGDMPPMTSWEKHRPDRPISGERVSLVWDYMGSRHASNPDNLPPLDDGINVVSPTWFHLADEQGRLENRADIRYVRWAHNQGAAVWALVSNSFDPDLTSAVIRNRERRMTVIKQLLAFAEMYNLDGINIDFENVYYEDRDYLTQFVRELTSAAHKNHLTVSIDVTAISSSPTWSMCYDREAFADIVDYIIFMGYDEYSRGSSVPGPVASLPWVERSVRNMLQLVPSEKLILGVPFYMRLWEEGIAEDSDTELTSRAVDMHWLANLPDHLKQKIRWDADNALNYLEFEEDGKKYSVWIEDEHSLSARLQLMHKYQLAGVAAWRRGFETSDVWEQIAQAIRWWPR